MAKKKKKTTTKKKTAKKKTAKKKAAKPRRARASVALAAAAQPAPAGVQFAGFDTGSYPGDTAIQTWAAQSPYRFVGFYFDAPCHTTHTFRSWSGKFPVIKAAGLGLAIVYVGLQQDGCGLANLSRAKGIEHGNDTAAKFAAEGFPSGAIVYLDIEHYNGTLSAPMAAYVRGWISAVLDHGTLTPGIYCPASKADQIKAVAEQEFVDHGQPGGAPVFWIVKVVPTFDRSTSVPAGCGVAFATVWQGRLDIQETHGGVTIGIDQNVAGSRDPSRALA